ncbi:MAG: tetratricopeptide repeat protein [Candidatus Zixiibacteriota bacterium]
MAWGRKAIVYKKLDRIDDAINCYKEILKLDPENKRAQESIAELKLERQ